MKLFLLVLVCVEIDGCVCQLHLDGGEYLVDYLLDKLFLMIYARLRVLGT